MTFDGNCTARKSFLSFSRWIGQFNVGEVSLRTCLYLGDPLVSIGSKSLNRCKKAGVKLNDLFFLN